MRSAAISELDLQPIVIPFLSTLESFIYLKEVAASLFCCLGENGIWNDVLRLGAFIEHVYLADLGKASVSSWPQDVSSVQGKSLQRLIPPAHSRPATSREGFNAESINYGRREVIWISSVAAWIHKIFNDFFCTESWLNQWWKICSCHII